MLIAVTSLTAKETPHPGHLRRRVVLPVWLLLLLLVASAGTGTGTALWYGHVRWAPMVVTGTVTAVNADVSAIGLRVDGWSYDTPDDGQGMDLVAHVFWTDAQGRSFAGMTPTCMSPGSSGQRVEVRLTHRGGPIDWVHCLS